MTETSTKEPPIKGSASVNHPGARVYESASRVQGGRESQPTMRRPTQPGRVYTSRERQLIDDTVAQAATDLTKIKGMSTNHVRALAATGDILAEFELIRRQQEKTQINRREEPKANQDQSSDEQTRKERRRTLINRARSGYMAIRDGEATDIFRRKIDSDNIDEIFESIGAHLQRLGRSPQQTDRLLSGLVLNPSLVNPTWEALAQASSPVHFAQILQETVS